LQGDAGWGSLREELKLVRREVVLFFSQTYQLEDAFLDQREHSLIAWVASDEAFNQPH
jgi:hypothetical protein